MIESRLNVQRQLKIVGSSLFTLFYAFLVGWFHWIRVWTDHYFEAGAVYIFYNAFRVAFLIYFTLILFALGRSLLRWIAPRKVDLQLDPLSRFLSASYVGAAVFEIVMVILGFLHLFYPVVALILSLPWAFLSFPALKKFLGEIPRILQKALSESLGYQRITHILLMGATLFLLIDLLVKKGLFPDVVGTDPVGHYLPYFNEVLTRHHLWPNPYFLEYFFSKGAGLNFLALLLTDIQGIQLASFYCLTLSALTLYALTRKMSFSFPWSCVAVIIYLKSFVIPLEIQFSKNHVAVTFWLTAILWLTLTILEDEKKKQKLWIFSFVLVVAALTLRTPTSLVFTLPYFFSLAVILWAKRQIERAKTFLILLIAGAGMMVIIFSFNYWSSGVMEITPSNVFLPLANISIMRQNWSPYALLTLYEFNAHGGAWQLPSLFRFSGASLEEIFKLRVLNDFFPPLKLKPFDLLVLGPYPLLFLLIFFRRRHFQSYFKSTFLCIGIMSVVSLSILLLMGERSSLVRFTQFFSFYSTLVGLVLWKLILSAFRKPWVREKVSTLVVSLIFLTTIFHYGLREKRSSIQRYPFLLGQKSFREAYGYWVPESCLAVKSILGRRKVASLNYFPGCSSLPGVQFEHSLMNSYVKDYHEVMFESALDAKETFRRYGVHHFLIDLNSQFHFTAFSPLFLPENMRKYLKIVWHSDGAYLLTWKEEEDPVMEESFLSAYTSKYESENKSFIAKVHEKIKAVYKTKNWPGPRFFSPTPSS